MTYFRDGKEQTTTVTPAAATQVALRAGAGGEAENPESAKTETPKAEIKDFGFEVQPLTPELAGQFGLDKEAKGLLISSVKEGSPAEAAGLEEGSVITKVVQDAQTRPVPELKAFQDLVGKSDVLAFHVQSKEGSRFVTLSKAKANDRSGANPDAHRASINSVQKPWGRPRKSSGADPSVASIYR